MSSVLQTFVQQYVQPERQERYLALASLLLANMTTVMGFGILALSQFPVLHALGITVGPGAVLALVLSMVWIRRAPKK